MSVYMFTMFGMIQYEDGLDVPNVDLLATDTVCYSPEDAVWYKVVPTIKLGKVPERILKSTRNKWLMIPANQVPSEYRAQVLLLSP